jgi:hypothetical protein
MSNGLDLLQQLQSLRMIKRRPHPDPPRRKKAINTQPSLFGEFDKKSDSLKVVNEDMKLMWELCSLD